MTLTDIATRTYNHGWRLDPIIRSLLDTDFYKLLMLQMIRAFHPGVEVTFSLINRSRHIRLADIVDEAELRAQLDHAREVRFSKKELIWLAGNSFYGKTQMFSPEFIAWLADFRLPDYDLRKIDGQYELHFEGPWTHTSMWEVPALAIINELRARRVMVGQKRFSLDVLYARAKAKMWDKVERLQTLPNLRLSDFGTRRRHGHLWQRWCVEALKEGLGPAFGGTSNVLLAMDNDLEAIGTNAHELPMVLAALADSDEDLRRAPYRVLDEWRQVYGGNLLIALPDAFGTTAFLRDAPDWVADWTGFRPDSAPPIPAGEEIIAWWRSRGRDPREKLLVFSDGLDVDAIERVYRHFDGKVRMAFGWGTDLTNDLVGCSPDGSRALDPMSLVCKVTKANGRPAVKLSDNPEKVSGEGEAVARYRRVFGAGPREADSCCHYVLFARYSLRVGELDMARVGDLARVCSLARIWVAFVLAVALIAAEGVANAQTLSRERLNQPSAISPEEMAALLRGLLTGRAGVGALRVEDGDIVFHAAGRDVRMGLTPLSRQFNALPDAMSRQGAFDKLAQRVDEAVAGTVAVKSEAESRRFRGALVPVLKNRAFVEQFAAAARKQGAPHARLLHVPLAGDIIVAAALDLSKITRFLAAGDGGAYGMSDPDILHTALDNLIRRVDRLEIRDTGLLRTFHFGEGDYNASILLLPNPWEKVPNLPRSVAIGVPSRNLLAFGDADDAKAVAALRALTKAPGNAFPVSRQLYQLSARGLTVMP